MTKNPYARYSFEVERIMQHARRCYGAASALSGLRSGTVSKELIEEGDAVMRWLDRLVMA